MYSFKNDYSEGAHPRIMQALLDTNLDQTDGYGTDPHCERARALIREKIACPEADVHFLVGGHPGQPDGRGGGAAPLPGGGRGAHGTCVRA